MHAHEIYSPRELSRWIRALHEASKTKEVISLEELLRLWIDQGLRLFRDTLVTREEAEWTDNSIDDVVLKYFPNVTRAVMKRPILLSNWVSGDYVAVEREELRKYVKVKVKVFYEEELEVPVVVFDEVLHHSLRGRQSV